MTDSPNAPTILKGQFVATGFATSAMFVTNRLFSLDIAATWPIWLNLLLYAWVGGLIALPVGVLVLLTWATLSYFHVSVSWWVSPVICVLPSIVLFATFGGIVDAFWALVLGLSTGFIFWLTAFGKRAKVTFAFKTKP